MVTHPEKTHELKCVYTEGKQTGFCVCACVHTGAHACTDRPIIGI